MSNSRYIVVPRDLLKQALEIAEEAGANYTAGELQELLDQFDAAPDHDNAEAELLAVDPPLRGYLGITAEDQEAARRYRECVVCSAPHIFAPKTPETPKAAPQKVEGDPGTWSHCGKQKKHGPHVRKPFAMNEGVYRDVQCNGTPGKESEDNS